MLIRGVLPLLGLDIFFCIVLPGILALGGAFAKRYAQTCRHPLTHHHFSNFTAMVCPISKITNTVVDKANSHMGPIDTHYIFKQSSYSCISNGDNKPLDRASLEELR
ncbi:hypothetical protein BDV96DRAFT_159980 [Lophiotrema nucula]|uniref:Uncharacterized protein n=1 Tax=Lophiotrema nucula TaxID=690887 RepID=A0A6A5YZ04_9PLEO|nr:hypothetical protein BDV96DRAFT_159980 [Lophiotrema nucula]